MDEVFLLSSLLESSDKSEDSSVKVSLLEQDYLELKDIAIDNSITLKKLINKSILLALKEIDNTGFYTRRRTVNVIDSEVKLYSLKIKTKYYEELKKICDRYDFRLKDIVRDIILLYPFKYFR